MHIHELSAPPPPELQRAIEEFEGTFRAPLGPDRSCRAVYLPHRTAFVRSLGSDSLCLVAEKEGRVAGVMDMALIQMRKPDGAESPAVYIAEIKLRPEARSGLLTARLLQKATAWRAEVAVRFSVVLDDTPLKPTDYSGRAGIPPWSAVGKIMVVRLPTVPGAGRAPGDERFIAPPEAGIAHYHALAAGRYAPAVHPPHERTMIQPAWFLHPRGTACGRFEDRRKVRRLVADDGTELKPAYLSCFAFSDADAAVELISAAQRHAESHGFRALRICMAAQDLAALQRRIGPAAITGIGATIYACEGVRYGAPWNVNASEV